MKIGIVGNGFIGQATMLLSNGHEIYIYDIIPEKCHPKLTTMDDIRNCDIIFICVPTPMYEDGSCCLTFVYSVINELSTVKEKIVLRSTVPVGTCDELNVNFMPEFLTEKNWKNDVLNEKNYIIGVYNEKLKENLNQLLSNKTIHYVTTQEAELCKLTRNAFLATKISFFNEIYNFCNIKNINYDNVRYITTLDQRIGISHTSVPGHDNFYGFGGICLPKDTESLLKHFEHNDIKSYIIDAVLKRNKNVDRPQQDWKNDKGRAII